MKHLLLLAETPEFLLVKQHLIDNYPALYKQLIFTGKLNDTLEKLTNDLNEKKDYWFNLINLNFQNNNLNKLPPYKQFSIESREKAWADFSLTFKDYLLQII